MEACGLLPFLIISIITFIPAIESTSFIIQNNCPYTIWPAAQDNANVPPLGNTGFALNQGTSTSISAPHPAGGAAFGPAPSAEQTHQAAVSPAPSATAAPAKSPAAATAGPHDVIQDPISSADAIAHQDEPGPSLRRSSAPPPTQAQPRFSPSGTRDPPDRVLSGALARSTLPREPKSKPPNLAQPEVETSQALQRAAARSALPVELKFDLSSSSPTPAEPKLDQGLAHRRPAMADEPSPELRPIEESVLDQGRLLKGTPACPMSQDLDPMLLGLQVSTPTPTRSPSEDEFLTRYSSRRQWEVSTSLPTMIEQDLRTPSMTTKAISIRGSSLSRLLMILPLFGVEKHEEKPWKTLFELDEDSWGV